MWIINGLFNGLIIGFVVFIIIAAVISLITGGDVDKAAAISLVAGAIVMGICVIEGVHTQLSDVWVDIYDGDQIVETYEIDDYSRNSFSGGVTFYLTDGRTMVRQDCVYEIRID